MIAACDEGADVGGEEISVHPGIGGNAYNARVRARDVIAAHPVMYYQLRHIAPHISRQRVERDSRLVIEGFPRSANTYMVSAFSLYNGGDAGLAHHLHAPAQLVRAANYDVPAILLIRDPLDAAVSLVLRAPKHTVALALQRYVRFYEPLLGLLGHVVVARFEVVMDSPGTIITMVNDKYGTSFEVPPDEATARVLQDVERRGREDTTMPYGELGVARPSDYRKQRKADLLRNVPPDSYAAPLRAARELASRIVPSV